eukprot:TRINITY_DN19776_c0_g1_i1.p1 TRINITY_DN19776_c0_g1~~TRINITY_DN19776_c0_g1_i1.p1  ORF type:complete len:442 (-),score=84.88 TRINITY_DN19776_c0_g1_i1:489-1814(-)
MKGFPDTDESKAPLEPETRDTEQFRAKLAAARLTGILKASEDSSISIDHSLYGAAIMIPQVARSAGWPKMLVVLSIRVWMFVIVNYSAQGLLLYMIAKEENVWDLFGGQMFLCDFGADSGNCPGGPDCVGPSGTIYNPSRVYGWNLWSTRTFARDTLKQILPDQAEHIQKVIDPGEYGVESYWCRLLCCCLFMMSVMSDLYGSISIAKLFLKSPTNGDLWIDYQVPTWGTKAYIKEVLSLSEMDLVKLKVAGMPLFWKVVNTLFILMPKLMLWLVTAQAGILFLMESSGIDDIVVNSVALAFILQIDEMLCETLMSETTKCIMDKLEDYETHQEKEKEDELTDSTCIKKYSEEQYGCWGLKEFSKLVPVELLTVIGLTAFFVHNYYHTHCVKNEAGGWVSKDMYLPKGLDFTFWNAFFPAWFPVESESEPFWTYKPAAAEL